MELLESTLRELEVREKAFKSLENYYLKELCPNFKERFKSFEIQDIDSYENYNLQNIMDDLRHIQVLLQGSPSKTSFKQKREFLVKVGQEMLEQIKKRAGIKTPGPALTSKKLVPVTTHEVKLPPLNTKLGYNSSSSQKTNAKTPKRAEEVKSNMGMPKTPNKAEAVKSEAMKKQASDKSHKVISLPEISEERGGEDGMNTRPHSTDTKDTAAFIEGMVLTSEQDEMLQRTLKKHGLKAEVWTNYLETKLNSYSNFHHDYMRKNTSQLDLHIEIAKFEQEYERYVLRKNRTMRSMAFGSSQNSMLLNNGSGAMSFRARSQIDDSRLMESGTYHLRQELDLEGKVGLRHEFLHMTPKKRFMSFKSIPLSQTPQKGELSPTMPTTDMTDSSHGRSRRDQMQSLDLTNSSRRTRVAPVLAVDLSPIKAQQEADSSTSDLNHRRNLKKLLALNSKDIGTLKKSHLISSIISRKDLEGEVEMKKTLKVSAVNTVNTISSAAVSSNGIHRMDSCCTINDVSVVHPTHLGSRRMLRKVGNEVSPWEDSSSNCVSIKSKNNQTMMTVASQVNTCFKISQIKSPTSEIKVSDILDLEYASNVRRIHLLGAGSEAKVFLCQIKEFEDIVALKQYELVKDKQNSFQSYESLKKEFNMLRQLNHDNIIKYLSLYKPRKMAYSNCIEFGIIMEYLSGGSLETYLDEKFDDISFKNKKSLMKQILLGIDYLHQNGIIHRDLKPGNILLSEDKTNVRITDFGISIKTNNDTSAKRTWVGTPWYMAPEVINQETYSSKADIWSAGCCFVHLLTGKKPYNNANAIQALMLMVNNRSPLETVDKKLLEDLYQKNAGVKELLESCFIRDKNDRPTAAQLLKLPIFSNI